MCFRTKNLQNQAIARSVLAPYGWRWSSQTERGHTAVQSCEIVRLLPLR